MIYILLASPVILLVAFNIHHEIQANRKRKKIIELMNKLDRISNNADDYTKFVSYLIYETDTDHEELMPYLDIAQDELKKADELHDKITKLSYEIQKQTVRR